MRAWIGLVAWLAAAAPVIQADTGVVRWREERGPWRVTLASSDNPTAARPIELSVLVQDRATGEIVFDADVDFVLSPPEDAVASELDVVCGMTGAPLAWANPQDRQATSRLRAIRGQTGNRLFYGAAVILPFAGEWKLRTTLQRGADRAQFDEALTVRAGGNRIASVGWSLAIPPAGLALFALHQRLRRRRL